MTIEMGLAEADSHRGGQSSVDKALQMVEFIAGCGGETFAGSKLPIRVGGRVPVTCTALGKVQLAFEDTMKTERVMSRSLPRITPYSVSMRQPLRLIGPA